MLKRTVILPLLSVAAAVSLAACGGAGETQGSPQSSAPAVTNPVPEPSMADPSMVGPNGEEPTTGPAFDGTTQDDTVKANMMDVLVPKGFKLPENALVTDHQKSSVMIADEDPTAVVDAVNKSAAESGYTVYAENDHSKVFVGNGNAVLFAWAPQFQMITWGPEAMKDMLKEGLEQEG